MRRRDAQESTRTSSSTRPKRSASVSRCAHVNTMVPMADDTSMFIPDGAAPHGSWPHDGPSRASSVALLLIDLQHDFISDTGYFACCGYDTSAAKAVVKKLEPVLAAARRAGVRVLHTREGHRPSLTDLPHYKRWRSARAGAAIGDTPAHGGADGRFLVRGEPGWQIVPEMAPLEGEDVFDKPGYGAFTATDLDHCLRCLGVTKLVVAGLTAEVCVHSTIREATDRGYECLLLEDGVAATEPEHLPGAVGTVRCEGGIFGSTAPVEVALTALNEAARLKAPDL